MRNRRVLLSVTGIAQNVDTDDDAMHLVTTGTISGGNDSWKLRYRETQPDSKESHRVTFTMGEGVVTMQREGGYNTNMVFEQGRRFQGNYKTPYGELDMGVFPTKVKYNVDEADQGEVSLKYQLDIQGQYASMRELLIRFVPQKA